MAVGLLSKCVFHWLSVPFPGVGKVVGGRRLSVVGGKLRSGRSGKDGVEMGRRRDRPRSGSLFFFCGNACRPGPYV